MVICASFGNFDSICFVIWLEAKSSRVRVAVGEIEARKLDDQVVGKLVLVFVTFSGSIETLARGTSVSLGPQGNKLVSDSDKVVSEISL